VKRILKKENKNRIVAHPVVTCHGKIRISVIGRSVVSPVIPASYQKAENRISQPDISFAYNTDQNDGLTIRQASGI